MSFFFLNIKRFFEILMKSRDNALRKIQICTYLLKIFSNIEVITSGYEIRTSHKRRVT